MAGSPLTTTMKGMRTMFEWAEWAGFWGRESSQAGSWSHYEMGAMYSFNNLGEIYGWPKGCDGTLGGSREVRLITRRGLIGRSGLAFCPEAGTGRTIRGIGLWAPWGEFYSYTSRSSGGSVVFVRWRVNERPTRLPTDAGIGYAARRKSNSATLTEERGFALEGFASMSDVPPKARGLFTDA